MPGMVAVLTGKDYVADKNGPIMAEAMPEDFGGPKGYRSQHFPLAVERVRYVGERVAIVIAETEAQARDAVDLVNIEYEELPVVVRAIDAVKDGAAQVYAESPKNICFTLRMGNVDAVEPAFAKAAHVTKLELYNNRLNAFTMEPRGCLAEYDTGTERFTVYSSTPESARAAPRPGASDASAGRLVPRHRQGCRRRLRHEGQSLSRRSRRAVGGQEGRPAGQMDSEPLRGLARRRSGPRSACLGRARARCRRQVPRAALEGLAQCRRLYRRLGHRAGDVRDEAGAVGL